VLTCPRPPRRAPPEADKHISRWFCRSIDVSPGKRRLECSDEASTNKEAHRGCKEKPNKPIPALSCDHQIKQQPLANRSNIYTAAQGVHSSLVRGPSVWLLQIPTKSTQHLCAHEAKRFWGWGYPTRTISTKCSTTLTRANEHQTNIHQITDKAREQMRELIEWSSQHSSRQGLCWLSPQRQRRKIVMAARTLSQQKPKDYRPALLSLARMYAKEEAERRIRAQGQKLSHYFPKDITWIGWRDQRGTCGTPSTLLRRLGRPSGHWAILGRTAQHHMASLC
jgi:hypothetical protein